MQERYYPVEGSSARVPAFLHQRPDLRVIKRRKAIDENFLNGFDSQLETEALRRNYNNAASSRRLVMISDLQPVISENLANMASHPREYAMSDPTVRNPVKLNENNKLANDESGYVIEDVIIDEERLGSTRWAVINSQRKLAKAKKGELVISISSEGRTGKFKQGKEFIYEETQVYVFRKGRGRLIEGVTFICDLTYEQCLELYGRYEAPDVSLTDMSRSDLSRVSEMAKRPISVRADQGSIEKVLDNIEDIMGCKVMRKANGKNRTFNEARELLRNPYRLKELPTECNDVLDKYQEYLEEHISNINDEEVFDDIKLRMEIAMLEITRIVNCIDETKLTGKVIPVNMVYKQAFDKSYTDKIDYGLVKNSYAAEIQYLMSRPGCAGKLSSSLTGQKLGDILSGGSNIIQFPGSGGIGGSAEFGDTCKICKVSSAAKGGCGYCDECAKAA